MIDFRNMAGCTVLRAKPYMPNFVASSVGRRKEATSASAMAYTYTVKFDSNLSAGDALNLLRHFKVVKNDALSCKLIPKPVTYKRLNRK